MTIRPDIAEAFDRVRHRLLLSKLPIFGLPTKLYIWFALLLQWHIYVLCDDFQQLNDGISDGPMHNLSMNFAEIASHIEIITKVISRKLSVLNKIEFYFEEVMV